jgi:Domain of unknown function (DUF4332)
MPRIAVVVTLVCVLLAARPVRASQYNVSEVPKLVAVRVAEKLQKIGVHSTQDILDQGATLAGRRALAARARLPVATIDTLARRADLLRLDSIGPEHVLLLEAVGVRSVPDLAQRDPAAVASAITAANKTKKIMTAPPAQAQISGWVTQSKHLPALLR